MICELRTGPAYSSCFTEGVGRCGKGVAREAAQALRLVPREEASPSAIQVRCGGIKGVLSVWPELCGNDEARFRPSQIKVETPLKVMQYGLSVVRVSEQASLLTADRYILPCPALSTVNCASLTSWRGEQELSQHFYGRH